MLTSRMKKTVNCILEVDGFITLKDIAEDLKVSSRTLLRELDSIEAWVLTHEGQLIVKKGKGIKIDGDKKTKERLYRILNNEKSELVYTPTDRSVIIRAEMLGSIEPMKLYTLTRLLDVTESTIANDLQKLEEWFAGYNISIVRRPGLGIMIDGDEKSIRKAIVALVYEQIDLIEFMDLIKECRLKKVDIESIKTHINNSIYKLLDIEGMKEARKLINFIEQELGYHVADNAFVALVIRISITIKRKVLWGQALIKYDHRERIKIDEIYKLIRKYINDNKSSIFVELPDEELLYLTMHIKGAKLRESIEDNKISMIEDFRMVQLVKEFILGVEGETGIYLADNEELMVGLVRHLRPAVYRMKMDLDIINPLLNEIRDMYPKLFLAISKCKKIIEERENVTVADDEIAYLATHIGAVIQKEHREVIKKFQVALACMNGIGASQLLMANIEKNFKNIEITQIISIIDYKMGPTDFNEIDLIITTVPIEEMTIPCIVVNPMLNEEDVITIRDFLKSYSPTQGLLEHRKSVQLTEKLMVLSQYSKVMVDVLRSYSFEKKIMATTMNEVILYASRLIATNDDETQKLIEGFEAREEKGSTILSEKGMLLLHCRVDIVSHVCLKCLQVIEPMTINYNKEEQKISTIVVMVGPSELNQKVLDVLSEITRCIITSDLSEKIINGQDAKVVSELNSILDKYYEKQVLSL